MDKFRSSALIPLIASLVVCFSPGSLAQDQSESGPPGVQILKVSWRKQIRLPSSFDPAKIPTRDAFVDPASKVPTSVPGSGIDNTRPTSSNAGALIDSDAFFPSTPGRMPVYYVYSMKVRNMSAKRIEAVAWTYAFLDRETKTELGRHQFLSYKKITQGRQVLLEQPLRSPPVRVVKAPEDASSARRLTQRATIECVLFEDGTRWLGAHTSEDVCKLLAKGDPAKRKPAPAPRQN